MTDLHGKNLIAGQPSALGTLTFRAVAPRSGEAIGPSYAGATADEIDLAADAAEAAFHAYASLPGSDVAAFLEKIAEEILALGDQLIECAGAETALPPERLTGERTRTINQFRMFAEVAREGSWRAVSIDRAIDDRKPLRKPDLRRILVPIGPVAVWAASNFPFAFSVAGGDTASALAAGCPVIVKAHPGHPGTSEVLAGAIGKAVVSCGLPPGVFSMLQGATPQVSVALVEHPSVAAGAFTGSLRAGRALYDAAARRPNPIPFFAEMGSTNPVFVLPGALAERGDAIADGLVQSVNMGVGQFCTCPGMIVAQEGSQLTGFAERMRGRFQQLSGGTMLTAAIARSYGDAVQRISVFDSVQTTKSAGGDREQEAQAILFETDARTFLEHEELHHEVFGPSSILIRCGSPAAMEKIAHALEGSLTATIHGTASDLRAYGSLVAALTRKAGRLVFNGYPTGVEVCASMQHGGPYPATTDPRFTSVGTAAILRFARPICYQDFPQEFLPPELRD